LLSCVIGIVSQHNISSREPGQPLPPEDGGSWNGYHRDAFDPSLEEHFLASQSIPFSLANQNLPNFWVVELFCSIKASRHS
jgi:hypothetical protein